MNEIDWSKQHCGLFKCPWDKAADLMPDVMPVLNELVPLLDYSRWCYTVDVKVHMLMPGQWPCIPNWHHDMVPRGEDGKQDFSRIGTKKMWLWVSGPPLTEFESGPIEPLTWTPFTQHDVHRGVSATEHGWRGMIRVCPSSVLAADPNGNYLRRHSQVYLDASDFSW